MRAMSNIYII